MNKIVEVKADYTNETNYTYIDVYFDNNPNSEGKSIGAVCRDTNKVLFFDNSHQDNPLVKDVINNILIKNKLIKLQGVKHYTLIELFNDEAPMVGTICDITNDSIGTNKFKEAFGKAVESHFDSDFNYDELPKLFTGSSYDDVGIEIDGINYTIRVIETWKY